MHINKKKYFFSFVEKKCLKNVSYILLKNEEEKDV